MIDTRKIVGLEIVIFSVLAIIMLASLFNVHPESYVTEKRGEYYESLLFSTEVIRYPANATIINTTEIIIGFVADPWNLNFGAMPVGGSSKRFMILNNERGEEAKIRLVAKGDIEPYINFSKNGFIIGRKENTTVDIEFHGDKEGKYRGEIDIYIIRPKSILGNLLMWIV